MKVLLEIEGDLDNGFHAHIVERQASDPEDERSCDHLISLVERTLHAENMDIDTLGTQ